MLICQNNTVNENNLNVLTPGHGETNCVVPIQRNTPQKGWAIEMRNHMDEAQMHYEKWRTLDSESS